MASPSDACGPAGNGRYDAIVVGGGIGGLVCAAYLAVAGRRVLLAEQHDVAGGNSQVFRRRRAYEFDVGVHYLGDCGPGGILPAILSGLGAAGRVEFRPMDPDGFDRIVLPGTSLSVPADWNRYVERVRAALPEEAAALGRCLDVVRTVAESIRTAMITTPGPRPGLPHPDFISWGARPLGELFAHCALSPRAATLLAAQSGNYGTPPSATLVATHATMLDHYLRGAYFPAGGGQTLVATLVEVIEAHGGEVRTRRTVAEILVSDDRRCEGIRFDDGETVHAPVVVSNADYRRTVLGLCRQRGFSPAVLSRTRQASMRAAVAVVYVALNRPLALPNANIWWWSGTDIESSYAQALGSGATGAPPFAFLSFGSLKDPTSPTMCPPGHSNFQIMTLVPPLDTTDRGYRRSPHYMASKEALRDSLVELAEQAIGPFRSHVTHLETATAHTNHRYTQSRSGSPYGLSDWGGIGRRPDARTSVRGLYVVGHNSRYGAGITGTALSGIAAAGRILDRRLLPEVHAGAVLGDPGRLPRRDASFDPLRTSRGLARLDARGLARIG